jgi:putative transcriptional regulator
MVRYRPDPKKPSRLTPAQRKRLQSMTDEEITRAAESDPDNPPMGEDPVFILIMLRRRLGLSQAAFAKRYGIPIGTLRDWEQGRTRPDEAAGTYIRVIEAMPDRVAKAVSAA